MAPSVTDLLTTVPQCSRSLFCEQKHGSYNADEHAVWRQLFGAIEPLWARHASATFLRGVERLGLERSGIPDIGRLNRRLDRLTGFNAVGVGGYLEASDFFACLAARRFPTSLAIRDAAQLSYLPEPDIFHDIAGHVPMHTDAVFANALVRLGNLALRIGDDTERIEALARFFWFTVEFGLISEGGELKAYGSGLLSSVGELPHAVESSEVARLPFDLDQVLAEAFEIDRYQPTLFVIGSFDELYRLVGEMEVRFVNRATLPS